MGTIRIAAAQFSTGTDVDANLAKALEMVDAAAETGAGVIVLPEFCNHLSIYDDAAHAWEVSVEHGGPWFAAMSTRASYHQAWVQVNVTLRRTASETDDRANQRITNSNLVFAPDGSLATIADKTVLMGAEGDYLSVANEASDVIDAGFATIGSYACMDGVVPEVPRSVAARGARLLLNSLNSFALDEASLHIPIRAAENRAFVVACCKVGPLLPADKEAMFSKMMGVPAHMLAGAGESQVVSPTGEILAQGSRGDEEVVVADIDLRHTNAARPDGTDVWAQRRPGLYGALAAATPPLDDHPRAAELLAATATTFAQLEEALIAGAELVVMCELAIDEADIPKVSEMLAATSAGDGSPNAHVVVSVRHHRGDEVTHRGVIISARGTEGHQDQLHATNRHDWVTSLGAEVKTFDLTWGRLGIIVGDDIIYPEVARLLALRSTDVIAIPLAPQEEWEVRLAAIERAAENRMISITAVSGPASESMSASASPSLGGSRIADLPPDFTLWATSRERPFDGTINQPDVTHVAGGKQPLTVVHPERSVHRQISKGTNLVDGRPWSLCGVLTSEELGR